MKLSVVCLLFCVVWRSSGSAHPKPACRYPPSQWCRSLEIAIACNVEKQCMEVNATRPNQAVPPVSVILYYESLCPDCRVFITQQLFPTWTMLQDIMTVTLVPYGNEIPSANSPFTCQHGEPECRGNMIESKDMNIINTCLYYSIVGSCLQLYAPSVSWSSVDSCWKGGLGYQLMHRNAVMTRALRPVHTHVPWLTVNGEYEEENEDKEMSSLFYFVCQLYKVRMVFLVTGTPI
uniref:Gamma-interferon-inducible lysosomal thiol reductase n=1 Tax=Cyclopterus lumpus TaxID=8103 RepID=A0A8C2WAM8_CYCLU